MHYFVYAVDTDIKQFQNLLEASVDVTERETIQWLPGRRKKPKLLASIRTEEGVGRGRVSSR